MVESERLRDIAATCRQVARGADTRAAIERLVEMADDYDRRAEAAEQRPRVNGTNTSF